MVISRVLFTAYHDFKEKLTNLSLNQAEKRMHHPEPNAVWR